MGVIDIGYITSEYSGKGALFYCNYLLECMDVYIYILRSQYVWMHLGCV